MNRETQEATGPERLESIEGFTERDMMAVRSLAEAIGSPTATQAVRYAIEAAFNDLGIAKPTSYHAIPLPVEGDVNLRSRSLSRLLKMITCIPAGGLLKALDRNFTEKELEYLTAWIWLEIASAEQRGRERALKECRQSDRVSLLAKWAWEGDVG